MEVQFGTIILITYISWYVIKFQILKNWIMVIPKKEHFEIQQQMC